MALIEGEGTPESAWLAWLPDPHGAPDAMPAWLGADQHLVVLAPHPDDEILACGGLIAMHVARGGTCVIVAVTDGEASDPRLSPEAARRLAKQRRFESQAGLACLGAGDVPVIRLGLPDGQVAQRADAAERALARRLRPQDVLLTTWQHDGHPDHEATGRCGARAAAAAGARLIEAPVWAWHWAVPGDLRVPWHRLSVLRLSDTASGRKQAALAQHRSQLAPRTEGAAPVLGTHAVDRARRSFEHYFV